MSHKLSKITLAVISATALGMSLSTQAQEAPKKAVDWLTDRYENATITRRHYKPEELVGQKVLMLVNLAPRTMAKVESNGMILMADGEKLALFNASDYLEIAIYKSNLKSVGGASTLLGLKEDEIVTVTFYK